MERVEDSDGDDRPKPNNLAAKIKKIDVKGILKKSNIFSDSSISSNQSMIGKGTNGVSYASKLKSGKEIKPIHFRLLKSAEVLEDVDIVLPKEAGKSNNKKGVTINKAKPTFIYRPVGRKPVNNDGGSSSSTVVPISNPFTVLEKDGFVDDEGIEIVYDETAKFMEAGVQPNSEGASTPGSMSFNG
ncbi:hypothetical protein L1987_32953 [Smallanthus sonchifolius]|uniref:Uncharacterized protein n=1 Tax=Smallanthus sonchifolius TaxID=185202 RepID=A0ACB9HRD2_9ASTR|nr:hypothetical protein L1987_32953 [Smallanthus sonchifolius]